MALNEIEHCCDAGRMGVSWHHLNIRNIAINCDNSWWRECYKLQVWKEPKIPLVTVTFTYRFFCGPAIVRCLHLDFKIHPSAKQWAEENLQSHPNSKSVIFLYNYARRSQKNVQRKGSVGEKERERTIYSTCRLSSWLQLAMNSMALLCLFLNTVVTFHLKGWRRQRQQ